jgi:methylenetetrahydrofolate reductase (NADPH)
VVAGGLLEHPRYEVIPTDGTEDAVLAEVPREVTVTVTASPRRGIEPTLRLAESLSADGYRSVPHVSARLVADRSHLEEIVARLSAAGIDDIFVPAGDADPPAGPFSSSLELLEVLSDIDHPFKTIGITGYPESHPLIHDDVTIQAMWDKRRYATYIVSNLCFDPALVKRFIKRVRARGVRLPIFVGLAGPVERAKLLAIATRIGVGESTRFVSGHAGWFLRLGAPGGYSPDRLLGRLDGSLTAEESGVSGLHIFTFNQLAETERWRQRLTGRFPPSRQVASQTR